MGKFSAFLSESDLFSNLTITQIELIDNICEELEYKEGEIIFEENSHQAELYLIINGKVEILINPSLVSSQLDQNVKSEVIAVFHRGQSFGEMALVDEGVRSATARAAAKNTKLIRISQKRFMTLCNTYPELGFRVMYNLAMDLAQKIRNTDLKLREAILYQRPANTTKR